MHLAATQRVRDDRIVTTPPLAWVNRIVWVNGIVWSVGAAWATPVGVLLLVGLDASDPGLPLLLFLRTVGVTVPGMLMIVLRAPLRQATALRTDLGAVT